MQIFSIVSLLTIINYSFEQYRMPEAYDQDGVVNQEKRFAAAMQRYRLVLS